MSLSVLNSLFFFVLVSLSYTDMESAIKTLVTTFVKSSRGKENLDSKSFQKLVEKNLSGVMEVSVLWLSVMLPVY